MPISFIDACLGRDLEVPTLDERIKYKIPEGTQTGTTFRLKRKGIKYLRSEVRGDLYVKVNIETPKKISEKQKILLREYEELNKNKSKSFFEKVKESVKR